MTRTSRRTAALLLGAALLLTGTAAAAPQPPRPDPARATFGVQPASATAPDTRPYLTYGVTPGAEVDDHVAVVNYSLRPLTLRVYATDALNDDRGGFALLEGDRTPTDAGAWIALGTPGGRGSVTVPAQSRAILPVRVRVPADATPGDHVAGVVASLAVASKDRTGVNVLLDQRVASRVYLRVAGALRPGLRVEDLHARYRGRWTALAGQAVVTFRLHNVGNVKLGGRVAVRVRGLLGGTSSARVPDVPLLLPGNHVDLRVVVPHVRPELRETATVQVRPLVMVGDADPGLHAVRATTTFWAVPWLLVVLLGLAALLAWVWRRRRRRPVPVPAAAPTLETVP